ncbi:hypothetical protein IC229_14360 [Spirosoma sp. BT702]|uniref:Uncharacterized protein n=1 Tax=Spirosoma profusum TaxID=2771354 RepID=A0A927AR74_9BACT|nr:hypothetical protein [Spirosoma profusum]MBD2701831.1 hypothetical protein [Spirosoma profusum]
MKIKETLGLFVVGVALGITSSWAQSTPSTPTGVATSTTYPQGAVAPDSMSEKVSRSQKKAMRENRRMMKQNARQNRTNTNTSVQDAEYKQSSASDGTSINNSNTTNYNSNNVTNAPTGAGSNPNTQRTMSNTTDSTKKNSSSTPPKP